MKAIEQYLGLVLTAICFTISFKTKFSICALLIVKGLTLDVDRGLRSNTSIFDETGTEPKVKLTKQTGVLHEHTNGKRSNMYLYAVMVIFLGTNQLVRVSVHIFFQ